MGVKNVGVGVNEGVMVGVPVGAVGDKEGVNVLVGAVGEGVKVSVIVGVAVGARFAHSLT